MSSGGRVESAALRSSGPARRGLIELGRIVNLHGVRGEVRVLPHNPDSDLLENVRRVLLSGSGTTPEEHVVLGARASHEEPSPQPMGAVTEIIPP